MVWVRLLLRRWRHKYFEMKHSTKYNFIVKKIHEVTAIEFIQERLYSKIMPVLTKHYLGCYIENDLVGVLTLGWGTQPKATINKLFPGLSTEHYYEIGKMCMDESMKHGAESQMINRVIEWIKTECPDVLYLYTWADGLMGKPGYVYQGSNFYYGGFIWSQLYITDKGEKVHPRSTKRLCRENYLWEIEKDPDRFKGTKSEERQQVFWLTQNYLDYIEYKKISGKQFRYILPLSKRAKKLLKWSTVEWSLGNYPKNQDLVWRVHTSNGYDIIQGTEGGKAENRPFDEYNGDYEYNDKNVNKHKRKTIEEFLCLTQGG